MAKKSNTRVYDKSEFIISPLHINLLHIYAYYDNHQLIEEEIEHKNTCFFYGDIERKNTIYGVSGQESPRDINEHKPCIQPPIGIDPVNIGKGNTFFANLAY